MATLKKMMCKNVKKQKIKAGQWLGGLLQGNAQKFS